MRVSALEVGEQVGKGLGGLFDGLRGGYIFSDGQGLCRVVVCHDVYCSIFTRFDGAARRGGKNAQKQHTLKASLNRLVCALVEATTELGFRTYARSILYRGHAATRSIHSTSS